MVPYYSLGFPTVPLVLNPPYYPPSFPIPPVIYNEYDNRALQTASQKRSATAVKSSQPSKQRCLNNSVSGGGSGGKKSFVTCIYCNNYNTWRSSNPPKSLICSACGHILFLEKLPSNHKKGQSAHSLGGSDLSSNSNDSQILVVNNRMRSMDPDYYGRHALLIRDVRHVISGLLYRVEKAILKEERQIQDDVQDVLSDLLSRVEHYLLGHLHCCCLQPALSQRHFIQCNKCDLWFHTSCVGVDSRKLGLIEDFLCPWCDTEHLMKSQFEKLAEEQPAICPFCKRQFPRPCNLSRHLHSQHGMKWSLHMQLHVDLDEYLNQEMPIPEGSQKVAQPLCDGCFYRMNKDIIEKFPMDKKRSRFLLRKLKAKPAIWWVNKVILIRRNGVFLRGVIQELKSRGEVSVCINGVTSIINPLFEGNQDIRFPILGDTYELELLKAIPYDQVRDVERDSKIFLCHC